MAYYRGNKRYNNRRRRKRNYKRSPYSKYKRRRIATNRMTTVPVPMNRFGLYNRQNFKLVYTDTYYRSTDLSASTGRTFRLNSLYDPLWTTGGNQPIGFDQWKSFYLRYMVTGCKIDAYVTLQSYDPVTPGTLTANALYLGIKYASDDDNTIVPLNVLAANPYSRFKPMNMIPGATTKLSTYFNLKDVKGNNLDQDDSALVSANPANSRIAVISVSEAQATVASDIYITMFTKLTYYGYFYQPKNTLVDGIS